MRLESRMLECAAAALLLLAAVMPLNAVAATPERASARADRLLTPLWAGGPTDPIASAMRKAERQILNSLKQPDATGGVASLLSGKRPPSAPEFSDSGEPERPRKLTPITAWSPLDAPALPVPKRDAGALVVLAAIDHGARPALPGERPRLSDASRLPWAGAPMLPALLTEPRESSAPAEIKRLVDPLAPPVPRRERQLPQQAGRSQALLPFASPVRSRSLPAKVALSAHAEGPRLSVPGLAALPSLDPLGEPKGPPRAFIMPFENGLVSSLYNQGRRHPAIDLAGRMGSPVFATSGGQKVVFAGGRGGYGNAVITRDADGREHLYGHLSAISTRVGVMLGQGDRLGALGSTGFSTGPHVHYEVKDRRGAHINPVTLLFPDRRVSNGFRWAGAVLPSSGGAGTTAQASLR